MKKYIKPIVEIVDMSGESLMAASTDGFNNGLLETGFDGEGLTSDESMLSKEHSFDLWEDVE